MPDSLRLLAAESEEAINGLSTDFDTENTSQGEV